MASAPSIAQRDFSCALDEFANALGRECVFTSDEDLKL
jgi:hypothetical protein